MTNKIVKNVCILVSIIALTACASTPEPPAISDISNADSLVRVQARSSGNKWPEEAAVVAEAKKGCDQFEKPAVKLSHRCVRATEGGLFSVCLVREYLFACRIEGGDE